MESENRLQASIVCATSAAAPPRLCQAARPGGFNEEPGMVCACFSSRLFEVDQSFLERIDTQLAGTVTLPHYSNPLKGQGFHSLG